MLFLKNYLLPLLFTTLFFSILSCNKDDDGMDEPSEITSYENGVFITNEGPFQNGTGTVSFYQPDLGLIANTIFQEANGGEELGNIVQSLTIHDDKAYVVVNNANKIVIANKTDFKKLGEITALELPRYLLPIDDQTAYVSQWGADGITGSIKVLDITTNTIIKTIATRPGPERMVKVDDVVYVANSGGFTTDSVITKIDIIDHEVLKTIEVGYQPVNLELDKNLDLWVLASGFLDWVDPENNIKGKLVRIQNDEVSLSIDVSTGASNLAINRAKDKLYFGMNGLVFEHPITSTSLSMAPYMERYFYGMAIDPDTDELIGTDPKDFQQRGDLLIFNAQGMQTDTLQAGIIPGGVWFD